MEVKKEGTAAAEGGREERASFCRRCVHKSPCRQERQTRGEWVGTRQALGWHGEGGRGSLSAILLPRLQRHQ